MDVQTKVDISGIVHLMIRDPGVRARLRCRPDWRGMIERRLIQLGDAFPSGWTFAVCEEDPADAPQSDARKLPFVPRRALNVSSTALYVSGIGEVTVGVDGPGVWRRGDDGKAEPLRDDEPVHVFDFPELPVFPGTAAIGLILPLQYSRDELHALVDWIYRDHEAVRRWQLEQLRRDRIAHLTSEREELTSEGPRSSPHEEVMRSALLEKIEHRLQALQEPLPLDATPPEPRLSDYPFRDLWCVREFLRGGTLTGIARAWDALARDDDLVAAYALRERTKRPSTLSRDVVKRSLERWLGGIGDNSNVRPDRTAPGGYRVFCPADTRFKAGGEVLGPSPCAGLEGAMHRAFHEAVDAAAPGATGSGTRPRGQLRRVAERQSARPR